jgi:superfamily II RNA helicase
MNNKGNWEFSFFQKTYEDKNYNINKEATIKVALRPDNGFNPKNIQQYINPEKTKEEIILDKKKNKEQLNTKEMIIMTNYLEKQKTAVADDIMLIEKYSLGAKPTTREGKIRLLLHTLDYQIKNNNFDFVANIYLRLMEDQFKLTKELAQEYSRLLNKMEQIISKMDLIKLQFTKFYTQMPPLNQKGFNKLDDWQIDVINNIDNNISTVITAPTSAGKSVISGYVTTKGKSLFVVPTDALAWQLSAYIGNILGTNVPILTKTYQTSPVRDDMIDILNKAPSIVGTADTIVDFLPFIKNDFKWIIFDEVHMIGKKEGFAMEYIAKVLNNVSFLALSATIGNVGSIVEWFQSINSNTVNKIECKKRFFNLQRYYYDNNKLNIIHPFALITEEDFITSNILDKNLEPTPPDVWDLVNELMKEFNLCNMSPYKFFNKDERIHLDKVNCYFKQLLTFMVLSYNDKFIDNKPKIKKIIDHFKINFNEGNKFKYSSLLFKLKEEQKLPAIVFQQNTDDCLILIKEFAIEVDTLESNKYPKLLADRVKMTKLVKKNDKKQDKEKLDDTMEKKSLKNMLGNKNTSEEMTAPHLQEPHPDFIFNTVQYFSNTSIEKYVDELKHYFPIVNDSYHYIIKLLWRGIGVYCMGLPDPYLRLVQTLANQKQLAVVFSDQSLVFGISMPFRSVVISKYKDDLDSMLYHQMAGRAGRRGLDKEGNVIFAGYSWDKIKELSISSMPQIKGCTNNLYAIKQANKLSELTGNNYNWSNLTNNYLDKNVNSRDNKEFYKDLEDNYKGGWNFMNSNDINYLQAMWKLRYNKDCIVITYLFPYIKRYFETKNFIHEANQIEIAHFLCRFICTKETNDSNMYLDDPKMLLIEPYNNIINELDSLQIENYNNIDKRLFLSIQHNTLYTKNDYMLREQLMVFGNTVKDLQHYYYHTKVVGLAKLLGKLLTRIWWIYHLSSPILQ